MPTESEIIARLRAKQGSSSQRRGGVLVGIGDDAAVLEHGGSTNLIACSDLSVEGVHFRTEWADPRLIGYKALAVTLSDVAAMGGIARYALVSVALPPGTSDELIDGLFAGVFDVASQYDVAVVGGDTSSSSGPLFVDTSVIGECAAGRAVTRGGARPGDLIFVTGELGASALGLLLLERGHRLAGEEIKARDSLARARQDAIRRHLRPEPRMLAGKLIGEQGLATSMIDISDGLSTDLHHLIDESGCGAIIHAAKLPISASAAVLSDELGIEPLALALNGGEDYELLFTCRAEARDALNHLADLLKISIKAVGEMAPGTELQIEEAGLLRRLPPAGYQHTF